MDINKYTELTGITVKSSQEAKVKAVIKRTKTRIETLLGFALKPKYFYTEKGKVQFEGYYPATNLTALLPPDEEQGEYRLFSYKEADEYFHVDPFTNIYKVKLVMPVNDGEFITVVDLENVIPRYERDGIGKYIKRYHQWFTWYWYTNWRLDYHITSYDNLQLAVDADWISCLPDDIMYLWADMVTHYSNPNYNIKSESVDGHSWSKASVVAPEDLPENKLLLRRYAGPRGAVTRVPVC